MSAAQLRRLTVTVGCGGVFALHLLDAAGVVLGVKAKPMDLWIQAVVASERREAACDNNQSNQCRAEHGRLSCIRAHTLNSYQRVRRRNAPIPRGNTPDRLRERNGRVDADRLRGSIGPGPLLRADCRGRSGLKRCLDRKQRLCEQAVAAEMDTPPISVAIFATFRESLGRPPHPTTQ